MSTEISGSIKTDITVDDQTYDVSVSIPTGKPLEASPYELLIYNKTLQEQTPTGDDVPTLLWMEAYYSADNGSGSGPGPSTPDNMYLELGPPSSILPQGSSFAINSLSIQFATGSYVTTPPTDGPKGKKAS